MLISAKNTIKVVAALYKIAPIIQYIPKPINDKTPTAIVIVITRTDVTEPATINPVNTDVSAIAENIKTETNTIPLNNT